MNILCDVTLPDITDNDNGTAIHKYVLKVVYNEQPLFVDLSAIMPL